MYKILWIDDEYDKQQAIIDIAHINYDTEIIPFKTSKDGMDELEENLDSYHAVILDAIVFNESDNETAKLSGLQNSIFKLKELKRIRHIPFAVFTGQKELENNSVFDDMLPGVKVFKKGLEINNLFEYLMLEIEKQPETQIRIKYKRAFEICTNEYIGNKASDVLLKALSLLDTDISIDVKDDFTRLRKILELLFEKLHVIEIIPDEIYNPNIKSQGWFNPVNKFLCGENIQSHKIKEGIIHPSISFLLRQFVITTQDASHNVPEKSIIKIDEFITSNQTTYFYKSCVYQLLEILIWFKQFFDEHSEIGKNKNLWSKNELNEDISRESGWIKGCIKLIKNNGWATFQGEIDTVPIDIPDRLVNKHNLRIGQIISIQTMPSPDGKKVHIKDLMFEN